jgi:hypothetical protein
MVGPEPDGQRIPGDFQSEWINPVVDRQGLGYVERENHVHARPALRGQVRKQRRNHRAMAMADYGCSYLGGIFRGGGVVLSQMVFRSGLGRRDWSARAENLKWNNPQILFANSLMKHETSLPQAPDAV